MQEESLRVDDKVQSEILGILFCEFDNDEGPKIIYQKPYELISKLTFDSISSYIITKTDLKNRLITIAINSFKILGYPIYIENTKYQRNCYIYNTCFIFDEYANTCSYEAVVKKLANDLKILEIECEFLSSQKKEYLPDLLEQIRTDLNKRGECVIQKIGNIEHSSLFLKLIKKHFDPQLVQSYEVPVFATNLNNFQIDEWDLTTHKILSTINGFKTVSQICKETNIEPNVVKGSIQNLMYVGIVILVPTIQYSSMFVTTPKLVSFYMNKSLQETAIKFIMLDRDKPLPRFADIFEILSCFVQGSTVQDIAQRHSPFEKNIDLKKLILFGLIQEYLHKINKYPVCLNALNTSKPYNQFNGNNNFDKLCSSNGLKVKDIERHIDDDNDTIVIIK